MNRSTKLAAAITWAAICAGMTGCTVAQTASVAVNRYCGKPEVARLAYRAAMADALAPHRLEIHCVQNQP